MLQPTTSAVVPWYILAYTKICFNIMLNGRDGG